MTRRQVPHAGCRANGLVNTVDVDGQRVLMCEGCQQRITDPRELAPRGSTFTPDARFIGSIRWDSVQA